MTQEPVALSKKMAQGYVIPIGPVNLVFAVTDGGMVGCGAFDVMVLDKFNLAAARVRSATGSSVSTLADLLAGIVREANAGAEKLGIKVGMTGKDALERM
jgi:uncharacterized protein YunC (DUF1805 family)